MFGWFFETIQKADAEFESQQGGECRTAQREPEYEPEPERSEFRLFSWGSNDDEPEQSYDYSEPDPRQEEPRKEKKGKKQKKEKFKATPENFVLPERRVPNFNGDRQAQSDYEYLKAHDPEGAELVERYISDYYTADVEQTAVYSTGERRGGFFMKPGFASSQSRNKRATDLVHEAEHMLNSHERSHGIPGSTPLHCQEDERRALDRQARSARALGDEGLARWCESQDGTHVYRTETESW